MISEIARHPPVDAPMAIIFLLLFVEALVSCFEVLMCGV